MTPVIVGTATLYLADCIEAMRTMPDNSIDSVVTDPPYHLTNPSGGPSNAGETPQSRAQAGANSTGFMGKAWDGGNIAQRVELWAEVVRVLKPGGHVLAFGGARTYHRMVCAIEDAGFEIRDRVLSLNGGKVEEHFPVWIFGSGFPKAEIWTKTKADKGQAESAKMLEAGYEGWARGGLKPAHEPICVARKPLVANVADNVLLHGVGALNIDACRVPFEDTPNAATNPLYRAQQGYAGTGSDANSSSFKLKPAGASANANTLGRFPANVIHDGSAEVVAQFPAEAGQQAALKTRNSDKTRNAFGGFAGSPDADFAPHDARGSAARFFYCPKASRADRNSGLFIGAAPVVVSGATMRDCETADWSARNGNSHPTVKPTNLMAYLCRLVTPPGGVVLDPFMGSGSTGKACMREGFRFVGCELEPEYLAIAAARIGFEHGLAEAANAPPAPVPQMDLFAAPQEAAA